MSHRLKLIDLTHWEKKRLSGLVWNGCVWISVLCIIFCILLYLILYSLLYAFTISFTISFIHSLYSFSSLFPVFK